jgi:YVTN family beta-propeller protein
MRRLASLGAASFLALGTLLLARYLPSQTPAQGDFTHFEGAHVHPVTLAPGGGRLFVVNTPDMRLSVFDLAGAAPALEAEIPVGLEPVSVAARSDGEVWVVNHLSDCVSIVDVAAACVRATLRVGDEPTDVVFAGVPGSERAFVCVSQEDAIKIFDPSDLAAPPVTLAVAGSDPHALGVNGDRSEVYATILESGNQTTIVHFQEVLAGGGLPPADPPMDPTLPAAPNVGLIVRWDGAAWVDELGRNWNAVTAHRMPDRDLVVVDAVSGIVTRYVSSTGTSNFNPAWNPADGRVWVTNTEARNQVRFEPNLTGSFLRTRLTAVDPGAGAVSAIVDLNPHIDYGVIPGSQSEIDQSLAQPLDLVWNAAGSRAYVAAFGSGVVAAVDASGAVQKRIAVGAGPSGLALDEARGRLYVVNRVDNTLSIVDLGLEEEIAVVPIGRSGFDPTPPPVRAGRRLFYDARGTSGHGDVSCASCHLFGNFDALLWDLGDPRGDFIATSDPEFPPNQLDPLLEGFHPMKGPMATQTLRGLEAVEPFHWRADRLDLSRFNPAFVSLLGNDRQLTSQEMADFEAFVMSLRFPPNPNQNLDRTFPDPPFGPSAARGFATFTNEPHDGPFTCEACHTLPTGTNRLLVNDGALQEDQDMKVPHLRNLYEKIGYTDAPGAQNKLGFGYTHDGVVDNLFNFLKLPVFQFTSDAVRRDLEAYLLAFDTGTAPAVGYQVTVNRTNQGDGAIVAAVNLLDAQAAAGNLDLVVKGVVAGEARGFAYEAGGYLPDRADEAALGRDALRLLATDEGPLTWTGVPLGSGRRAGIDRDRDGHRDRDELDYGTDPADPASFPGAVAAEPAGRAAALRFAGAMPNPSRGETRFTFTLPRAGQVRLALYDVRGRELRVVARGFLPPGEQRVAFDGRDAGGVRLGPGVYFASLRFEGAEERRPVVVLP